MNFWYAYVSYVKICIYLEKHACNEFKQSSERYRQQYDDLSAKHNQLAKQVEDIRASWVSNLAVPSPRC